MFGAWKSRERGDLGAGTSVALESSRLAKGGLWNFFKVIFGLSYFGDLGSLGVKRGPLNLYFFETLSRFQFKMAG